jgi:hypothetical protein
VGNPERKRPMGGTRRRCEDNREIDLRKIVWGSVNWIYLAHDRD